MNKGLTLVELLLIVVVIGVLAALLLPMFHRPTRHYRVTGCMNNLAQLWKMQHNYLVQYGGPSKSMPTESGGQFWLKLTTTSPPLIDASLMDIFACQVKSMPPGAGRTDYRGPNGDVNHFADGDAVGADKVGNHGVNEGGNVLLKLGDVQSVAEGDPFWHSAARQTAP